MPASYQRQRRAGLLTLLLIVTAWRWSPLFLSRGVPATAQGFDRLRGRELNLARGPLAALVLIAFYFLLPTLRTQWERIPIRIRYAICWTSFAVIPLACAVWIFHFGNHQFGGYDFSILIDTSWRLFSGERPYIDFPLTTPPAFYLGAKYAFHLFGVNWNAQLFALIVLSMICFFWSFWLLRRILKNSFLALLIASAIQSAAFLILDFWWYNDITAVLATLFLLSAMAWSDAAHDVRLQASYVISLALLALAKPNVSGLLIASTVLVLLLRLNTRTRTLVLTVSGVLLAWLVLLVNGIQLSQVLKSYAAAAGSRGFGVSGIQALSRQDLMRHAVELMFFTLPAVAALRQSSQQKFVSLYFCSLVTVVYAIFTNGEFKEVEMALLLPASAALFFRNRECSIRLHRAYLAFIATFILLNLYIGAQRIRVMSIGPGAFFSWNAHTEIQQPFFRDLVASSRLKAVLDELSRSVKEAKGSVFFGPRMEFGYALFGLRSPEGLPVWWHPGTSFASQDEDRLIQVWADRRFDTLIFLRDDFTYYPPVLRQLIARSYWNDPSYIELSVFHARDDSGLRARLIH